MKNIKTEALEKYFNTGSEHDNGYIFSMLCDALSRNDFEDPEIPLKIFDTSIEIFCSNYKKPVAAFSKFSTELEKFNLSIAQKQLLFEWIVKYLKNTTFEGIDLAPIQQILKGQIERLQVEVESQQPLTNNIRDTLKSLIQQEIAQLPETLKGLDPVQRLNILCKLIPYVMPKVESVSPYTGERGKSRANDGLDWLDSLKI